MTERNFGTETRLAELVKACPECDIIADIGTDHGKTALMLIESHKCRHVIATDISRVSLEKAEALFRKQGRGDFATFLPGDGLQPIPENASVGAAVISGIGGETISRFLRRDLPLSVIPELIISPQTDVPLVRKTLYGCGYHITRERVIESKGRFYHIINAHKGERAMPDEEQIAFGNVEPYTDTVVYERYRSWLNKVLGKIPDEYRTGYLKTR